MCARHNSKKSCKVIEIFVYQIVTVSRRGRIRDKGGRGVAINTIVTAFRGDKKAVTKVLSLLVFYKGIPKAPDTGCFVAFNEIPKRGFSGRVFHYRVI